MKLSEVDLTDPDIFQKAPPFEMFALLRRESPVHWHESRHDSGFFAITKYADLKHVSKDPKLFSSAAQGTLMMDPTPESLVFTRKIMLNMDPPQHRQYRGLVNKAFTKRMVDNLKPRIQEMVQRIVDDVIERGECDFVEDVAAPLPMEVICEMMGVPEEDRRRIYEIGNSMVGFDDPELQEDGKPRRPQKDEGGHQAAAEMFMYASRLREKAEKNPSDDLASALVHAELDGEKLTPEDFQFFFLLLLIAGNETTRTVTTNGMISLLDNPDQYADLRANPQLVDSAVEEILRYSPAVHTFRRQTTADTEIRGVEIPADSKLMLWYTSANRDEEIFDEPDEFDIRRWPNDHLAFGVGEHFCLGANLARMELREIFKGILRFEDMEFAAEPRRLRSAFINGVKEMQVRFRPGPRRSD